MGYYIPRHLRRYIIRETDLIKYAKIEFNSLLRQRDQTFEEFYKKLRKIDRAVFLKVSHILHFYGRKEHSRSFEDKDNQLRFLVGISVVESCFGNGNSAHIKEFLSNNVSEENKKELMGNFDLYNRQGREIKAKTEKMCWQRLLDIRNNFMHRSIFVPFADTCDIFQSSNYHRDGLYTGVSLISFSTDRFISMIKEAVINYFLVKPTNHHPKQNYSLKKRKT